VEQQDSFSDQAVEHRCGCTKGQALLDALPSTRSHDSTGPG
jgi:hypothetical protein